MIIEPVQVIDISGHSSRKGSVCSTPVTSRGGGEVDYPSLSFVRNPEQA